MKKICFLLSKFSKGGAERVVSILSDELMEFYDVEILLLETKSEKDYKTNATIREINQIRSTNNLQLLLNSVINLKKYIKENEPFAIISFMELPNLVNMLIGGKHKRILSVRNHMSTKWNKSKNIWNFSIYHLYNKADVIVVPTKVIQDDLINEYHINKSKIKIIKNPYQINKIEKSVSKNKSAEFKIVTMGSLVKAKGVYQLLNSYIYFCKKHPEIESKLIYIGSGEEEEGLKKLAKKNGIEKNVIFKGFLSNPHVVLSEADLYVLASYYEGFPNALVEAMICKVPVISTNCPSGPSEILSENRKYSNDSIIKSDYGFIMPVFDKEEGKKEYNLANFFYDFYMMSNFEKHEIIQKAFSKIKEFDSSIIAVKWKNLL